MTTQPRVISAIATALLLAACATTTSNVAKPTSTVVAQNPDCLNQTGSLMTDDRGNCAAIRRSYSKHDIDTTGKVNFGDALQQLDPSINVHH
jgi:uncharacterized lipoprotein YajG